MKIFKTNTESILIFRGNGFSLLEVMVALSIIAIALTSVLSLQSQGLSLSSEARFNTTASLLSRHKTSEIETAQRDDLLSGSGEFGEDFPDYSWRMEVSDVSVEPIEGVSRHLKQIDLVISRKDIENYQYRVRLVRFIPETE